MSFGIINNLLHDDEGNMKKIPQEKSYFNRALTSGNKSLHVYFHYHHAITIKMYFLNACNCIQHILDIKTGSVTIYLNPLE